MANEKLEALIIVESPGWKLRLTDNDGASVEITVPSGYYYWSSVATEHGGTVSLLTALKTALDNGAGVTYTLTLDDDTNLGTGRLTIAVSAGNFAIVWDGTSGTSTELRDLAGFAGNISSSASAQGTKQVKRLWLPDSNHISDEPNPAAVGDPFGSEEFDYVAAVAPSGAVATTALNTRSLSRSFRYEPVLGFRRYRALETDGAYANASWQTFIRDIMGDTAGGAGVPFRFYADRANDALFWTLAFDLEEGPNPAASIPLVPGWRGARAHWAVEFVVRQYLNA